MKQPLLNKLSFLGSSRASYASNWQSILHDLWLQGRDLSLAWGAQLNLEAAFNFLAFHLQFKRMMQSTWFPVAILAATLIALYKRHTAFATILMVGLGVLYLAFFLVPQISSFWSGIPIFGGFLLLFAGVSIYQLLIKSD